MKLYRLYVKQGDNWEMACTVQAPDKESAMQEAVMLLNPQQRKLPMDLREEGAPTPSGADHNG